MLGKLSPNCFVTGETSDERKRHREKKIVIIITTTIKTKTMTSKGSKWRVCIYFWFYRNPTKMTETRFC